MTHILLAVIYLAFISLGLPDSLLGAAWPSMYGELGVPVSRAGMVSMIICFGTIISSLQSSRLTSRFGPGRVTAASVAATAAALLGFSASRSFWQLCLWAVPYGLGAGSVDAALNHYVALHFKSRHMSWLHCMWGVGAFLGPSVMGTVLAGGYGWSMGYRAVGLAQTVLAAVLVISLPLWKMKPGNGKDRNETAAGQKNVREEKKSRGEEAAEEAGADRAPGLLALLRIPMARETVAMFFCYNALETTAGLWASSYLVLVHKVPAERAAALAGLFYLGITAGRAVSGFLTEWISDDGMIRLGTGGGLSDPSVSGRRPQPGRPSSHGAWLRAHLSQCDPFHAVPVRGGAFTGCHWRTDGRGIYRKLPDAAVFWIPGRPSGSFPVSILSFSASGGHGPHASEDHPRETRSNFFIKSTQKSAVAFNISSPHSFVAVSGESGPYQPQDE